MWFLNLLLFQNLWNHGNLQRYGQSFLRGLYQIQHQQYPNLSYVIFETFVDCKSNTNRPSSKMVNNLWLGHMISRLLANHGFPVQRGEATANFLVPYT